MKLFLAQLNFVVGDIEGNLKKILTRYNEVKNEEGLLICGELALTGYYPQDLIVKESVMERQRKALNTIREKTLSHTCGIVIGYIAKNQLPVGKKYHNALALMSKGAKVFEYHKRLLPTYNVFDEARHFEPGKGSNVIRFNNKTLGFLICEDAWSYAEGFRYWHDPVNELAVNKPDVVISINASPSNLGKMEERLQVIGNVARKVQAPVAYVNQIGGNDELVFDGASFVVDKKGDLVHRLKSFEEDFAEIDFGEVVKRAAGCWKITENELLLKQTVLGIKDYVQKCGFSKVVIGSSGGIDSAVTIAICARALGAENVTAITMPSRYSSSGSVSDSEVLCKNLGVRLLKASIEQEFSIAVSRFESMTGEMPSGLTRENIQARIRGRILMEYSNHFGALVISTGNKSEMSVGYATLYGDMNGGVNPLGDLYKMEVYGLANFVNEESGKSIIPKSIIEKAPSAELSEDQKDSDSLPDYPILDAILKLYIEGDLLGAEEKESCEQLIERANYSKSEIRRIHAMVDKAEFKRRQAPPIIRVQKRSFGMGRWLPVAAKY
ncbi:NAD+ synthase [Aliikangiella coralliicola]|nr:NAD+ synthase [Aliikangiella coralliicola]